MKHTCVNEKCSHVMNVINSKMAACPKCTLIQKVKELETV